MPSIQGQSVLIIGASTGIGFAVAKLCLENNMTVHIASSNPDKISHAASRLHEIHPNSKATTHVAKLGGPTNESVLTTLLDAATAKTPLDHIIVTAGDTNTLPLSKLSQPHLEEVTSFRIYSLALLAKLAPTYLVPHWTSSLIFTGGAVAEKPAPNYTFMSFLAGGLHPFAKAVALEIKPVRCNVVAPGATETEMWGGGEQREMIRRSVEGSALLGKAGRAEEVAEGYVYLMRDTNATGMNVSTSGGVTLV